MNQNAWWNSETILQQLSVLIAGTQSCLLGLDNFHSRAVHLNNVNKKL